MEVSLSALLGFAFGFTVAWRLIAEVADGDPEASRDTVAAKGART